MPRYIHLGQAICLIIRDAESEGETDPRNNFIVAKYFKTYV